MKIMNNTVFKAPVGSHVSLFSETKNHLPPQSTFCNVMRQHLESLKRTVHVVNLDPAAENFEYPVSIGTISLKHLYFSISFKL
jgi:hypothetical protein